jgi:hypothetical protein
MKMLALRFVSTFFVAYGAKLGTSAKRWMAEADAFIRAEASKSPLTHSLEQLGFESKRIKQIEARSKAHLQPNGKYNVHEAAAAVTSHGY